MAIKVIALVLKFKLSYKSTAGLTLLHILQCPNLYLFLGYEARAERSWMIYLGVEPGCQIGLGLILILSPSAHSRGFV